jgi:hypothetical protein
VPGICYHDRYVGEASLQKYRASGTQLPKVSFVGNQMLAAGIRFGRIVLLGCIDQGMVHDDASTFGRFDGNGKPASESEAFDEWLNLILESDSNDSSVWDTIQKRYGMSNVLEAFSRTLVGNRNHPDNIPLDEIETTSEASE